MSNFSNTVFGWVLAGGIAAVGLSIIGNTYYHSETPEKPGFAIEGGDSAGGGDSGPSLNTLLAQADVAKGEKLFAKCTACHTITQGGANGVGPNLYGVVGKPHGVHPGFAFSDSLKKVPGNWSFEALDAWLKSPKKYADGTKMSFAGLSKGEDRANVIAYLNAQGSNLPLPAADAPAAPAEGAAPAEAGAAPAEGAAPAAAPAADAKAAPAPAK